MAHGEFDTVKVIKRGEPVLRVQLLAWVLAAVFSGFMGRRHGISLGGYFFGSVLVSPIIASLMLIGARPAREQKKAYSR
jgi:hypothetical protein